MTSYRWIVTHDPADMGAVGLEGPRGADPSIQCVQRFRIYDSDGIFLYEGLIGGEYEGFEPLDDFGTPNIGSTSIYYENDGVWEEL